MNLDELSQLVSEIRKVMPDRRLIIFGSSSLLPSCPDATPAELGVELTLDADFFIDPDDSQSRERLTAIFGNAMPYHAANGFYGDFVDYRGSGSFPKGWQSRLRAFPGMENVFVLDPLDVATNKLFATGQSRVLKRLGKRAEDRGDKDINTVTALLLARVIDDRALQERLLTLEIDRSYFMEACDAFKTCVARAAIKRGGPPLPPFIDP